MTSDDILSTRSAVLVASIQAHRDAMAQADRVYAEDGPGVECRKCPHLAALDTVTTQRDYTFSPSVEVPVSPEQRDVMKAWTCTTHILMRGGDAAREGYILTTDDRMYWQNVYASLAGDDPGDGESDDSLSPPDGRPR